MASQNVSEEFELTGTFNNAKKISNSVLIYSYRFINFLFRNIIILLVLIALGIVLGLVMGNRSQGKKETTMLVQINFEGANYVYDAITQLQGKIEEKDVTFLENLGFYEEGRFLLRKIEIFPIVNINEILKEATENDRSLQLFLEQAQYEDEVLRSEIFIPAYRSHKIEIATSFDADEQILEKILIYLNDHQILQDSRKVIIENTQMKIKENQLSVKYIDSVVKNYGNRNGSKNTSGQIYINTMQNSIDYLHMLIREKGRIIDDVKFLEIELLKYEEPVVVLNKPVLQLKKSILDKAWIFFPILLLMLFFIFSVLRKAFLKAKRLSQG